MITCCTLNGTLCHEHQPSYSIFYILCFYFFFIGGTGWLVISWMKVFHYFPWSDPWLLGYCLSLPSLKHQSKAVHNVLVVFNLTLWSSLQTVSFLPSSLLLPYSSAMKSSSAYPLFFYRQLLWQVDFLRLPQAACLELEILNGHVKLQVPNLQTYPF
jgi:hypothetical protein